MKIDNQTLLKFSIELKFAMQEFMSLQNDRLWQFIQVFNERDRDFILSQFDNYGVNMEYEKSGLRVIDPENGVIAPLKFGFTSREAAKHNNPLIYRARLNNLNVVRKTRLVRSIIRMPKTRSLIDVFKVIYSVQIFNTTLDEALIYLKILKMKTLMNNISEKGMNQEYIEELDRLLENLNRDQRNKILELFDSELSIRDFKGIRYVSLGEVSYVSVDKKSNITQFKYNLLHIPKTKTILEVWKNI